MIKPQFLANLSHELRMLLNAIIDFYDLTHRQTFGLLSVDKCKEFAGDTHNNGNHIFNSGNDFLDFFATNGNKRNLKIEQIDLPFLLKGCVKYIEYNASKKVLRP